MEVVAMSDTIQRIGLLTGGGDCPGLNAVIRAAVKTAISEYGWEVLGIEDGFEGLIKPGKARLLDVKDVRGLLPRGGTILGSTNRANPFHYEVHTNGESKVFDVSETVVHRAREYGIEVLIVIGGDGSMRIAHELMQQGLQVVGVPKTIDNDLYGTEISVGFDTAVNTAMEALDKLHTTAESHHRVLIVEVMGRHAGWIALAAGVAGGADVILIPEIPYHLDVIADKINQRNQSGAQFSIVVVAEGSMPLGGEAVYQAQRDLGGVSRLGGIGEVIAAQLRRVCHADVRATVLGHLQRGGSPTAFDRLLATRFGAMAVYMIAQGTRGHMVALRDGHMTAVPMSDAVSRPKQVPLESDLVRAARGLTICLGDRRQAIVAGQEQDRH
jgi:ATP-dependent phosphofructokinase / diphosphate-dependent phosphofructokinase